MIPVVPKIRAGEILLATKHLREWFRLEALLDYMCLIHLLVWESGSQSHIKKAMNLSPKTIPKDEEFLVVVNQEPNFLVWGKTSEAGAFFSNAVGNPLSSADFAHWFIRTGRLWVDVAQWHYVPRAYWALLHMNAVAPGVRQAHYPVWMPQPYESTLSLGSSMDTSAPDHAFYVADLARKLGHTRPEQLHATSMLRRMSSFSPVYGTTHVFGNDGRFRLIRKKLGEGPGRRAVYNIIEKAGKVKTEELDSLLLRP